MTDQTNAPDVKNWWESRTIWAGIVTVIASAASLTGHNIDPGTQTHLVNDLTALADLVSVIGGAAAVFYRTKATTTIAIQKKQ